MRRKVKEDLQGQKTSSIVFGKTELTLMSSNSRKSHDIGMIWNFTLTKIR